jgi:Xaa-Pro aminopeptidase
MRIKDDCVDVSADLTLEVDMVLNLETPIFMPGVGSLHVEQTFVVTSGGSRPLVPQDRETPFLPAAH